MQDRCKSAVHRLTFGRKSRPDRHARISRRMPGAAGSRTVSAGRRLFSVAKSIRHEGKAPEAMILHQMQ
jgi:hypothetical protein